MANYIGNIPSQGEFKKLDSIASSFDGTTTQFNLNYNSVSQSVGGAEQLIVSLNGVIQEPLTAYTLGVGGSSIVFASAPQSGDTCHIVLFGGIGQTVTPSDQSVTAEKLSAELKDYYEDEFTANGATTDFTLSREATGVNQLMVSIDGILQPTSAYTVSGTTFTVSPALPNGTNIRVVHMGVKAGVFVPQQNSVGLDEIITSELDSRYYTETEVDNALALKADQTDVDLKAPIANPSFTGNVGIGTSSPTVPLQVEGEGVLINRNAGDPYISMTTGGSSATAIYGGSNGLRAFTSGTERMRIDSSGHLLVGKSVQSIGIDGVTVVNGQITATADGLDAIRLNRKTSDGSIIDLRKDGTTVGSIGSLVSGRDLHVNSTGGILTLESNFNSTERQVVLGDSYFGVVAGDDNAVDLGRSVARYKDLYLSGGIQFDSRSNKLDDYEEGQWTPSIVRHISNPVYTASSVAGYYRKVGTIVHISMRIIISGVSSQGSGNILVAGLPFSTSTHAYSQVLNVGYNDVFDAAIKDCYVTGSSLQMIPVGITQSNYNGNLSTGYLSVTGTYITA